MEARDVLRHIVETKDTERMKNTYKYNEDVRKAWTPIWVRNSHRSYEQVEKRFTVKDCDIHVLPKKPGTPVLILGSGPSLDDIVPHLKDWKGDIMCSTSQLAMLKQIGVEPTYLTLIDCDPAMLYLVRDYDIPNPKTIFITHPQVPREYIEMWKGDVYFFRMLDPGDDYSTKFLELAYGWMNQEKDKNYRIGSYVLNSGNVVNTMIPIAQQLGYSPIFLCGYDLGYPGEMRRCSTFDKKDGEWVYAPPQPLPPERPVFKGNNGVTTDELGSFYKYSFMILYGLGCPQIISCSRGILSELPYVAAEEVVKAQGKGFDHLVRSPKDCYEIAREYLHYRTIYIMKTDFNIESVNINSKKGFDKFWYPIRWRWLVSRPWRWMGGKGYIPWQVRRMIRLKKKSDRMAMRMNPTATPTAAIGQAAEMISKISTPPTK